MKKFVILAILFIIALAGYFIASDNGKSATIQFNGPVGEPSIKGPSGPPPERSD